jgi:LPS-assembly lipoprotein
MAILAAALLLGGCFTPLYGEKPSGTSVRSQLATMEISQQNNRVGLEVRNELLALLNNGQEASSSRYRLELQVFETGVMSIVDTVSGRPQSYATGLRADIRLYDSQDSKTPLLRDTAMAETSYDRTQQRFASLRAARSAQDRAARTLAEQIHLKLAAHFSKGR